MPKTNRTVTQRLSRTANAAAKGIVRHIEEETGKSLSLQTCLNLTRVIQTCMDEAVAKDRSQKVTTSNRRLYAGNREALERLTLEVIVNEITTRKRSGGSLA